MALQQSAQQVLAGAALHAGSAASCDISAVRCDNDQFRRSWLTSTRQLLKLYLEYVLMTWCPQNMQTLPQMQASRRSGVAVDWT